MAENIPPDDDDTSQTATWVTGQLGKDILQDEDNYTYHQYRTILGETQRSYRCQMKRTTKCPAVAYLDLQTNRICRVSHAHNHMPDLLKEAARASEKELIRASAVVGNTSTINVIAKIKTQIERSEVPEATTSMRKKRALSMAIRRERTKVHGGNSVKVTSLEDIKEKFPDKFKRTSTGDQFLHYCEYLDPENKKQLMIIFMSDHGKWVLSHAEELYVDGTFGTKCENFAQIYFVMGKMAGKTAVPVVYALLPNKLTNTYKKFWEIVMENVNFEPGLPSRIMSDFEKGMQNTLKTSFPQAELLGCNFHFKSAVKKNVDTKGNNCRIFCTL